MKRICIVCLTGLFFFTACENRGSSSVASWENAETAPSTEKNEHESHEGQVKEKSENVTTDTSKTSTHSSVEGTENKTDTSLSVDSLKEIH